MSCNIEWCDRYTGEDCGITWCPAYLPRNTSNKIVLDVNTIITGDTKNDLVAVVRCKDCKYRAKGLPYCAYFGETGFCSKGERRETE